MRKLRSCPAANLNTGSSKCAPNFDEITGAILVEPGTKLPDDLTAEKLEELVHAGRPSRIYGIYRFVEYAKNGGEVQTSANGYGPEQITGISARKDTFTLSKFSPELDAALTRCSNQPWDVYFFDSNNILYGIDDGSGKLAGYPMSGVYSDTVPFKTSSSQPTHTITFMHENAKTAKTSYDYEQLDFNINSARLILGLTPVILEKTGTGGSSYKLYEKVGGYDVTGIYGPLIVTAGESVVNGATSAISYDETTETLTIASSAGADIRLKSPAVLYENGIKGIEQVV